MLTTKPYKGARDFFPEDMQLRSYIFSTWRKVCERFGYQEYDAPIVESFDLFAAKSGAEIVNEQLYSFTDRGDRKLAIRPELTPGTVRMLADKYNELTRPVRWFMIGNNWRNEKPQKGRGREFYQLEVNIFGENEVYADFEIFQIIVAIMKEFGANESHFSVHVSDRRLLSGLLADKFRLDAEKQIAVRRLLDKWHKLPPETFREMLQEIGLSPEQIDVTDAFMRSDLDNLKNCLGSEILDNNAGFQTLAKLFGLLKGNGLADYVSFDPSIIRGFDYSDGLVYEVFDKNPENHRSLFGGERFDRLINIFNPDYDLAATGFAMGDITLGEFLKGWQLVPEFKPKIDALVSIFSEEYRANSIKIAAELRDYAVNTALSTKADKLDKQFKHADKLGIPYVIIVGPDEAASGKVSLKNMQTGTQTTASLEEIVNLIKT